MAQYSQVTKIVMNPPYDGNLHLKVVQEAMKHSDDVVNLSPIKWRNPRAFFEGNGASDIIKKYPEIFSHLEGLDVIDSEAVKQSFGTEDSRDLGIYHITKDGQHRPFSDFINEPIVLKILKTKGLKVLNDVTTVVPQSKHFYRVPVIYGNEKKEWLKKICSPDFNRYYQRNEGQKHCKPYVNFDSKEECLNFHEYLKLTLPRYVNYKCRFGSLVCIDCIPYLGDYTHPWDDAALYKYFGLTQEEISLIEEEMK